MESVTPSAAIPLLAALITGSLGLLGLIIAKETKVSEFRQAWIDALRTEVADMMAALHQCMFIIRFADDPEKAQSDPSFRQAMRDSNKALFMVRLRLNEGELESQSLLKVIDDLEKYINDSESEFLGDGVKVLEGRLTVASRFILKKEWDRVGKGEVTYKAAKWIASGLVIILFIAFFGVMWTGFSGNSSAHDRVALRSGAPTSVQLTPPTKSSRHQTLPPIK